MTRGTNRLNGGATRRALDIPHLSLELAELTRLTDSLLLLDVLLLLRSHQALQSPERAARLGIAALEAKRRVGAQGRPSSDV